MRFELPRFPCTFELPDEWLDEAGFRTVDASSAYRCDADHRLVPLVDIAPPARLRDAGLDWRGFGRDRMISVLRAIAEDQALPPVRLWETPPEEFWGCPPYRFRVADGHHRYFAAVAFGFAHLPVEAHPAPAINASPSSEEIYSTIHRVAAERGESLLSLSVKLGKNEAYLQQFIKRGTPKRLPEEERLKLAQLLWIDERLLGAREPWSPPRS